MNDLVFREIQLNGKITVELPAHVWIGFLYEYSSCEWNGICANSIVGAIQDGMLSPLYVKEREAAIQEHSAKHNSIFASFLGMPPGVPPNISGITDVEPNEENGESTS